MVSGSVDKTAIIWKKTGDQVNNLNNYIFFLVKLNTFCSSI